MRKPLLWVLLAGAWLACGGGREVVVTREQFGESWPLEVNSATVICEAGGDVALLKLGVDRYALSPKARARGYPDAAQVATGDPAPLAQACVSQVAAGG